LINPRFPAFKANVTAYTVAVLSRLLGERISLDAVWQKQGISAGLGDQIIKWSDEVNHILHSSSGGRMISEWAKKKECWEILKAHTYSVPSDSIAELRPSMAVAA
jgi:hypothetical protein